VLYENLSQAERYDAGEASYRTFRKTPVVDAALDLITDLVGDRRSDLTPIRARYGAEALAPIEAALEKLRDEGRVSEREGAWEAVTTDGVFIDPFWPILETAMQAMSESWTLPLGKQADNAIPIGSGDRALLIFIEKISPDKRYFCELGRLGIYYRHADPTQAGTEGEWIEALMREFLDRVRPLVERVPTISPRAAAAQLRRQLATVERAT